MDSSNEIKTVIFPVAGLGSRFLPATKVVAKELLPILNKPLIDYAMTEAIKEELKSLYLLLLPRNNLLLIISRKI